LNDALELPSLEEIEQMERQRSQAIESLEISNDFVKCQKCGDAVQMPNSNHKPYSLRIHTLQSRIKRIESHYYRGNSNNNKKNDDLETIKAELAELEEEEEAKADKLTNLPLYSCKVTRWKFVCSTCYDNVYHNNHFEGNQGACETSSSCSIGMKNLVSYSKILRYICIHKFVGACIFPLSYLVRI